MKRLLFMTAAALFVGSMTLAQAQSSIIMDQTTGKEKHVKSISITKTGDYQFVEGESGIKSRIQKNKVAWAWIPKPEEIKAADAKLKNGDFAAAEKGYKSARNEYEKLGWNVYCLAKAGEAMSKQGKNAEAVQLLDPMLTFTLVNPKEEDAMMDAFQSLATAAIEVKNYDKAMAALDKLQLSRKDSDASFALVKKGDVQTQKNLKTDAVLSYLQVVLLFPKNNKNRPEALYKAVTTLQSMNDNRSADFAKMMKTDYPSDPLTSQLK